MDSEIFKLLAEIELDHWWFVARRRIIQSILEVKLPAHAGKVVVDVGCGTGATVASLADRYEVVGIDTTSLAIELARKRFNGVQYIIGSAPENLGEIRARMDAVILMDVLEHVPHDSEVLRPIVDSIQPGGLVLLTVPADMKLWGPHDEAFGHYRRYDKEGFRSIWQTMPVREIMVSYFCSRLYPLVRMVRWYGARRRKAWGRAGSDLVVPWLPVNWMLQRIFEGEAKRLVKTATAENDRGYSRGVSLVALLERTSDTVRANDRTGMMPRHA